MSLLRRYAENSMSYLALEEAVFDLESYSMSSGKAAKVRASVHQAVRDGLTVREYVPGDGGREEIERQFFEISDAWLERKHTSLLKFALGGIGFHEVNDKRYFYAADKNGVIQGFLVFLPYRQGQGYLVDVMRRRPGCTHGVMELIFHDTYEKLKAEGIRYGSLGIAPFANTAAGSRDTVIERLEHYNYENMNEIYGFKPLYEAKAKYAPTACCRWPVRRWAFWTREAFRTISFLFSGTTDGAGGIPGRRPRKKYG